MQVYTNLSIFYRICVSCLIGCIVGIIGGIVRLGWENLFPIYLNENLSGFAQVIFDFLHLTPELLTMDFVFANGYEWRIILLLWQFGFSILFAIIYVIIVEFCVKLKFAHGIFYGIILWILVYVLFLPLCGFVVGFEKQTWIYFVTSLLECLLWNWIIELTRRDLRNRITDEKDPF